MNENSRFQPSNEKGQSFVLVAFALLAMLAFGALAVDASFAYVQRRQMQNAADAGALAGSRRLGLYQADPTSPPLTNGELYDTIAEYTIGRNQADELEAYYALWDGTRGAPILKGDTSLAPRDGNETGGVIVIAKKQFRSFFAAFLRRYILGASAIATSQCAGVKTVTGLAPIAVRETEFQVGDTYRLWDSNREASANRGWLGLDCKYPEKGSACSPDANSLESWMRNGYPGAISAPVSIGGDPGTKSSALHEARVGQILILPVYDAIYHFTNYNKCDPFSPQYDPAACWEREDYADVVPLYTDDPGYNGKYYFHIVAFAAFEITAKQQLGSDKYLDGTFISYVVNGDWGNPINKGVIVCKMVPSPETLPNP